MERSTLYDRMCGLCIANLRRHESHPLGPCWGLCHHPVVFSVEAEQATAEEAA